MQLLARRGARLAGRLYRAAAVTVAHGRASGAGPALRWQSIPSGRLHGRARGEPTGGAASPLHGGASSARWQSIPSRPASTRPLAAVSAKKAPLTGFPADHASFWISKLDRAELREPTRSMLPWVDRNDPLGVDVTRKGVSDSPESVYTTTLRFKKLMPRALALIRVGEFYETMGYDALCLVQFAGYNPMGAMGFKAGLPWRNLERDLRTLTNAGFSVAVVEEVRVYNQYGGKSAAKERYLGGVVTPAQPVYVHGFSAGREGCELADDFAAPPMLGVALGARGFMLLEVRPDMRSYHVSGGLSEPAVVARLRASSSAPLYIHGSLNELPGFLARRAPLGGAKTHAGAALAAALAQHEGEQQRFHSEAAQVETALLDAVRRDLSLGHVEFRPADAVLCSGAPRPLALTTALSLGVLFSPGVPNLLSALLPADAPRCVAAALQSLLLSPPRPAVAESLAQALALLADCHVALPTVPLLPGAQVARLVNDSECSAPFLGRLVTLCDSFAAFGQHQELQAIAAALLPVAELETGMLLKGPELEEGLKRCKEIIEKTVAPHNVSTASREVEAASGGSEAGQVERLLGSALGQPGDGEEPRAPPEWPSGDCPPACASLPPELFQENEGFRGRVRRELVADAYDRLEAAALALDAAVGQDLCPLAEAWLEKPRASGKGDKKVEVVYDKLNNAIWLKVPKTDTLKWAPNVPSTLKAASDRKGADTDGTKKSTERVEQALEAYHHAAYQTEAAVTECLRAVSKELQPHLSALVGAAAFSLYLRLAVEHEREARRRGWCLPELLPVGGDWQVERLTPPWMSRDGSGGAVPSSLTLNGMFLLTGPNMAGKSTVIRAAGACALLANCGLHVPAASARVPRFSAFHVRMASADAPLQKLSHWAMDMSEAVAAVEAATSLGAGALILLDELGQGTEYLHAAAMAAALLGHFDASGCRGIFATHLHAVLDLTRDLPRTRRMCMETVEDSSGVRTPTLRMVEGESTESLAFEVAADCDMPRAVVEAADRLLPRALELAAQRATAPAVQPAVQPGTAGQPAPVWSLEEAVALLLEKAALVTGSEAPQEVRVPCGHEPPPRDAQRTVAYLLRTPDGRFYCGETADLKTRLKTHRRSFGADLETAYIVIPPALEGKNTARRVETETINALLQARQPMLGVGDSNNKSFGGG